MYREGSVSPALSITGGPMARTPQLPKLTYSTREVAAMIGVSRPTVDRLVRDGVLPSVDLGSTRRTLIPAWAVERLVGDLTPEHSGDAA